MVHMRRLWWKDSVVSGEYLLVDCRRKLIRPMRTNVSQEQNNRTMKIKIHRELISCLHDTALLGPVPKRGSWRGRQEDGENSPAAIADNVIKIFSP